jgi:hypothetical protein
MAGSESVFAANEFTFREWHAAVLGGSVGAVAAFLPTIGYPGVGVTLAGLVVGVAFGVKRLGSVAGRTVRKEPWYALTALVAVAAVVRLFA